MTQWSAGSPAGADAGSPADVPTVANPGAPARPDRRVERGSGATAGPSRGRRRRRDRHGRGRRGVLAPPELPLRRSRAEQFDDLVLDAVEDLETHWADELEGLQFAVEDVPAPMVDELASFAADIVADHGVVLAELFREGLPGLSSEGPGRGRPDRGAAGPAGAGPSGVSASGAGRGAGRDGDPTGADARSAGGRATGGQRTDGQSSGRGPSGRSGANRASARDDSAGRRDPVLVVYRRPVEARTDDGDDRADLVFSLVVELVAEWLGRDVEDIDPR